MDSLSEDSLISASFHAVMKWAETSTYLQHVPCMSFCIQSIQNTALKCS